MSFAVHVSKGGRGAISAKLRGFHLSLTPVPVRRVCARVVGAKAARGAETVLFRLLEFQKSFQEPVKEPVCAPSAQHVQSADQTTPHESKGKCTVSMLLRILLKSCSELLGRE